MSLPANCWLTAIAGIITSIKIAMISSMISTTREMSANLWFLNPKSPKAFITIVVEDITSIPAKIKLSIVVHPKKYPVIKPTQSIVNICVMEVTIAVRPTFNNFLMLNSNPNANNKKMIPISDHSFTLVGAIRLGKRVK